MSAVLMFSPTFREESSKTQYSEIFRFSVCVATAQTRIIKFYEKRTKWRLFKKKISKNSIFWRDFSIKKNSKNQNFEIILVQAVPVHVTNM